jgi:hypothetical protein
MDHCCSSLLLNAIAGGHRVRRVAESGDPVAADRASVSVFHRFGSAERVPIGALAEVSVRARPNVPPGSGVKTTLTDARGFDRMKGLTEAVIIEATRDGYESTGYGAITGDRVVNLTSLSSASKKQVARLHCRRQRRRTSWRPCSRRDEQPMGTINLRWGVTVVGEHVFGTATIPRAAQVAVLLLCCAACQNRATTPTQPTMQPIQTAEPVEQTLVLRQIVGVTLDGQSAVAACTARSAAILPHART